MSKYDRTLYNGTVIDVYDVLDAFNVTNPATQHAIKKLLVPGERGHKSLEDDYKEAYDSIARAIELETDKDTAKDKECNEKLDQIVTQWQQNNLRFT